MNSYEAYLERALKKLPDVKTSGERFVIPEPHVLSEGKTTVFENFINIADALNREPEHILKCLLRELGTAGKIDGSRAILQGKFSTSTIAAHINSYVKEYVLCSECNRPDTHLIKSDRVLTLRCDACGAHRPVKKRSTTHAAVVKDALTEGEIYDVTVTAIGAKGDGIVKKDRYTIIIPRAKKGDTLKIRIKKISGTLAFAEIVT